MFQNLEMTGVAGCYEQKTQTDWGWKTKKIQVFIGQLFLIRLPGLELNIKLRLKTS